MKKTKPYLRFRTIILCSICLVNLFTLVSCDIQKKRYSRGYTVNWNKKYSSQPKINESTITSTTTDTATQHSNNKTEYTTLSKEAITLNTPEISPITPILENKTSVVNESPKSYSIKESEKKVVSTQRKTRSPQTITRLILPKQRVNLFSIIALVFSFLFFLLLIPLFLSIIFSVISLCQVKKRPYNYKRSSNNFAITALVLDFTLLFIILTIIFSGITSAVIILLLLFFLSLIVVFTKPIPQTKTEPTLNSENKPKEETKPIKKSKGHAKLNKFWVNNRFLLFLITVFSAFLFIPLTL